MPKTSAGLLLYRQSQDGTQVFLVHPGGPFWSKKDAGAWSIPKGEFIPGEDPLSAARREFQEETGVAADGEFHRLEPVQQKGGKVVHAWAVSGEIDAAAIHSNTFSMEWPPKSDKLREFPEIDRAAWFGLSEAQHKILPSQLPLLYQLKQLLTQQK